MKLNTLALLMLLGVAGCDDINQVQNLITACRDGNVEFVHSYIDSGAELDVQSLKGDTPLNVAVANKEYVIVEMLVRAGASSVYRDVSNVSPREIAEENDDQSALKLLRTSQE